MSTKRLTAHELLLFQSCKGIANSCKSEHDSRSDQAAAGDDDAQPLDQGHDAVDSGSHVVCREASDERIELGGRRADTEEKGDFDEYEDEGRAAAINVNCPFVLFGEHRSVQ